MAGIARFEDIRAWQTARQSTNPVYRLPAQPAFSMDFGLQDQIRPEAVSVISRIAEGFESRTDSRFITSPGDACASSGEVRAYLYFALDQKYAAPKQFQEACELTDKASRQIANFIKYLASDPRPSRIGDG
jgi:four helix bundle protein